MSSKRRRTGARDVVCWTTLVATAGDATARAARPTVGRHGAVLAVNQRGPSRALQCRLQVKVFLHTYNHSALTNSSIKHTYMT